MRKKYIFHLLGSFLNSQGWAKGRQESETAMGLPYRWQEPRYLGLNLLSSRHIGRKLYLEQR